MRRHDNAHDRVYWKIECLAHGENLPDANHSATWMVVFCPSIFCWGSHGTLINLSTADTLLRSLAKMS